MSTSSDSTRLSLEDLAALRDLGIRTVVDLRSKRERCHSPSVRPRDWNGTLIEGVGSLRFQSISTLSTHCRSESTTVAMWLIRRCGPVSWLNVFSRSMPRTPTSKFRDSGMHCLQRNRSMRFYSAATLRWFADVKID